MGYLKKSPRTKIPANAGPLPSRYENQGGSVDSPVRMEFPVTNMMMLAVKK